MSQLSKVPVANTTQIFFTTTVPGILKPEGLDDIIRYLVSLKESHGSLSQTYQEYLDLFLCEDIPYDSINFPLDLNVTGEAVLWRYTYGADRDGNRGVDRTDIEILSVDTIQVDELAELNSSDSLGSLLIEALSRQTMSAVVDALGAARGS